MDLYRSKFDLLEEHRKLLWPVEDILSDESLKLDDWWRVFEERRGLTIDDIKDKLIQKDISFKDEDLFYVLQILLSNYKRIVRDDFWNKDTEYRWLDRQLWEHKSQEVHYSFVDEFDSNKTFLLISDTHIGHELFSAKLLHNLYDYAIKRNACKCFHLGDLFHGCHELSGNIYDLYGKFNSKMLDDFEDEFIRQMEIFIKDYPNPEPSELKTYCLQGNHDESMDRFLKFRNWTQACDLRKISIYNKAFYMFPRPHWVSKINGYDMHFNHRLYMSAVIEDLKINDISDISKKTEIFGTLMKDSHYDILFSGHLHRGIIYSDKDFIRKTEKLYVGVPSTTSFNIGRTVGYLVHMHPEEDILEIEVLGCDNNLNIYEIDRITWNLKSENKSYCRTL